MSTSPRARPLLQRDGIRAALDPVQDDEARARLQAAVGDTLLFRARNLERELGLSQLWLKFEGDSPTGTQKDRIAFAQALDARERGYTGITVATCGNYGVALAIAAEAVGIACHIGVPSAFHTKRIAEMERFGASVARLPGTYEDVVEVSRGWALVQGWYDANPGGPNVPVQLEAYAWIATEIVQQMGDAPQTVATPMSNGTTLAGIHQGFEAAVREGRASALPRLLGGSAWKKNPITHAFRQGLEHCPELRPEQIRETATNEPLINWRSLDGDLALQALRASDGGVADVSDRKLQAMARTLRQTQGLSVLPASTAGLVALVQADQENPLPPGRHLAVLTGRA